MSDPSDDALEIVTSDGVLSVRGEIDMETAGQLSAALEATTGTVVLDLADVTFINSSGLLALVKAQHAAQDRGDNLVLRRPSPVVERVLEVSSMMSTFVIER